MAYSSVNATMGSQESRRRRKRRPKPRSNGAGWSQETKRWNRKAARTNKRTRKATRPVRQAQRILDRANAEAAQAVQQSYYAANEAARLAANREYLNAPTTTELLRSREQQFKRQYRPKEATWEGLGRAAVKASVVAPIPAVKGIGILTKAIGVGGKSASKVAGKTAPQLAKAAKKGKATPKKPISKADEARLVQAEAKATRAQKVAARANVRRGQKVAKRQAKGKNPKRRHLATSEAGIARTGATIAASGAGVGAVGIASEEKTRNAATLPVQLGIATANDPVGVAKASAVTLKDALLGLPAAVHQAVTDPGEALEMMVADYQKRYGPLLEGDFEKFRKHVGETGLTPYAFDALIAAPPAGRLAGAAARKGALGPGAKKLATAKRRDLQVAPGRTRQQPLSKNLLGAGAQKTLDLTRAKADRRRRAKGKARDDKPALTGGKGTVAPLRAKTSMRKQTAQTKGRYLQAMQSEQLYEVHRGVSKEARTRLSAPERKAAPVALQLGIPGNPDIARAVLTQRIQAIAADRTARLEADPSYRPPRGESDNIRLFRDLIKDADKAFTPRLEEFITRTRGRVEQAAAADPALDARQAQIRSATPQAELRGVTRPAERLEPTRAQIRSLQAQRREARAQGEPATVKEAQAEIVALKEALRDPNSELRRRIDEEFLSEVDAKRGELLPGGYMPSQMRMTAFAPFAVGGRRAIASPKQYKGSLYREGAEDLRIEALATGLAQNIKRRYNWNLVADTFEEFSYSWSRGKDGKGMRLGDLRKQIQRRGYTENQVVLWNPSRFRVEREGGDGAELIGESAAGAAGLQKAITKSEAGQFDGGPGWVAIPKAAYDEMSASAKQTKGGRIWDITVQKQSRILLGAANIPWLQFQVLSNGILTGLAGARPFDFAASVRWWNKMPDAQKKAVEPYVGIGHFQSDVRQTQMGAAAKSNTVNAWRGLKETAGGKYLWRNTQVRDLNPFDIMFRSDNAQNNYFRRTVLYNQVRKDAWSRLNANASGAGQIQNRFLEAVGKAPPEQVMRQALEDMPAMERHAQHVNEMLGDYTTYTARERAYLKKSVMFYGFLRFSLRFAFWTMPTKHPVMTGIMGNLSKLKAEETMELLGGAELPYALGRIRFLDDKTFVDLARANPVTNSLVGIASAYGTDGKFFAATGMLPPIVGMGIAQIAMRDTFTGKPWLTSGAPMPRNKTDYTGEERARIALSSAARMFYPYRVWNEVAEGGKPQGADSLAWDTRPTQYSEPYKTKQEDPGEYIAQETFPLGGLFFESLREVDNDPKWAKIIREGRRGEQRQIDAAVDPEPSSSGSGSTWGGSTSSGATWGG